MLTEMFSRLRAMRPGTRLAALLCAAAVACCLALPPVVFAVWDGMLFAGMHPRADAGQAEPLGDAARANPAACLRAALDGSGYLLTAQDGPAGQIGRAHV